MNGTNPGWGYPPSIGRNSPPDERRFAALNDEISGRSVVITERPSPAPGALAGDGMWPCSLSDFIKDFKGKNIQLEYVLPGGSYAKRRGRIRVAGTNFIGIQPQGTNGLLLVDLSSVKSIAISDCYTGS